MPLRSAASWCRIHLFGSCAMFSDPPGTKSTGLCPCPSLDVQGGLWTLWVSGWEQGCCGWDWGQRDLFPRAAQHQPGRDPLSCHSEDGPAAPSPPWSSAPTRPLLKSATCPIWKRHSADMVIRMNDSAVNKHNVSICGVIRDDADFPGVSEAPAPLSPS